MCITPTKESLIIATADWFASWFLGMTVNHSPYVGKWRPYMCMIIGNTSWYRCWKSLTTKDISMPWNIKMPMNWIGLDLFNEGTRPSGHISRPTQVDVFQGCSHFIINYSSPIKFSRSGGQLKLTNCIISDRRITLLAGIPLCKSREFSRREYSMSQLCSIRHDIHVILHTPGGYGQCSVFDLNGDKQSAVLGTTYGTLWPLYDQFEVRWLQPLQHWLNAGISLEVPMLVSRDK